MDEKTLEKLAVEEILKEAKRGAERAKEMGSLGWQKSPLPPTNKTFLRNMLVSTMRDAYNRDHSRAHKDRKRKHSNDFAARSTKSLYHHKEDSQRNNHESNDLERDRKRHKESQHNAKKIKERSDFMENNSSVKATKPKENRKKRKSKHKSKHKHKKHKHKREKDDN